MCIAWDLNNSSGLLLDEDRLPEVGFRCCHDSKDGYFLGVLLSDVYVIFNNALGRYGADLASLSINPLHFYVITLICAANVR